VSTSPIQRSPGPLGLVAAKRSRLGAERGTVQALAAQVGPDGALADLDARSGAQDVGDVGC